MMPINGRKADRAMKQEKYKYEVTQEIGATGTINQKKSQKDEKK
jgi:hypothetical protein